MGLWILARECERIRHRPDLAIAERTGPDRPRIPLGPLELPEPAQAADGRRPSTISLRHAVSAGALGIGALGVGALGVGGVVGLTLIDAAHSDSTALVDSREPTDCGVGQATSPTPAGGERVFGAVD